jgi:hypothetical protein
MGTKEDFYGQMGMGLSIMNWLAFRVWARYLIGAIVGAIRGFRIQGLLSVKSISSSGAKIAQR